MVSSVDDTFGRLSFLRGNYTVYEIRYDIVYGDVFLVEYVVLHDWSDAPSRFSVWWP